MSSLKNKFIITFILLLGIILTPKYGYALESDTYEINLYEYKKVEDIPEFDADAINFVLSTLNNIERTCEDNSEGQLCRLYYKGKQAYWIQVNHENQMIDSKITLEDFTIEDNIEYILSDEEIEMLSSEYANLKKININLVNKEKYKIVYIKDISLEENSETAIIKNEPTKEELNVNLDLKFNILNDYVTYKVLLMNNTDKDYEINDETQYGNDHYIKYEFFPVVGKILPKNSSKELLIKASYDKQIPDEILQEGFHEDKEIKVELLDEDGKIYNNPKTSNNQIIVLIALILLAIVIILASRKQENNNLLLVLLASILFIPVITYAYENINITINSKVEVAQTKFRFVTNLGSFSDTEDVKETYMTVVDDGYTYTSINTSEVNNGIPCFGIAIKYNEAIFSPNSYIKIYDQSHNLLLNIDSSVFPKNRSSILNGKLLFNNISDQVIRGICNLNQITIENSDDLNNKYSYYLYGHLLEQTYIGPWIVEQEDIEKIKILKQKVIENSKDFIGFTKCNIYEEYSDYNWEQLNDLQCTGSTYYAMILNYDIG